MSNPPNTSSSPFPSSSQLTIAAAYIRAVLEKRLEDARPPNETKGVERSQRMAQPANQPKNESAQGRDIIRQMETLFAELKQKEAAQGDRLDAQNAVIQSLSEQVSRFQSERATLCRQAENFNFQASSLAVEARASRQTAILTMFGSAGLCVPHSKTSRFKFANQSALDSILRTVGAVKNLSCIPHVPNSMPVLLLACGHSGYWFHRPNLVSQAVETELLVENFPNEWTYYGRYISNYLPSHPMKLSEWLALDEQTKRTYVSHLCRSGLPTGQMAQVHMHEITRRRLDSGETYVPCFSLKCVGYNLLLYSILEAAAASCQNIPGQAPPHGEPSTKSISREGSTPSRVLVGKGNTSASTPPALDVKRGLKRRPEAENIVLEIAQDRAPSEGNPAKGKKKRRPQSMPFI